MTKKTTSEPIQIIKQPNIPFKIFDKNQDI